VESARLLRDEWGLSRGLAYVRFREPAGARLCAAGLQAEWSESERAQQREASVYGLDVRCAFCEPDGKPLAHLAQQCGCKVWALGAGLAPPGAPPARAEELHLLCFCEAFELDDVREALAAALARFHEWTGRRLRQRELADRWQPSAAPPPTSRYLRQLERLRRGDPPRPARPGATANARGLTWNPATGMYTEEELPQEVCELMGLGPVKREREEPALRGAGAGSRRRPPAGP